jgi:hypothetical protein
MPTDTATAMDGGSFTDTGNEDAPDAGGDGGTTTVIDAGAESGTDADSGLDNGTDVDSDTIQEIETEPIYLNPISNRVSDVTAIEVVANIQDGFVAFSEETWYLDVTTGLLTYFYVEDYGWPDEPTAEVALIEEEQNTIVNAVLSANWGGYGSCFEYHVDGTTWPPVIRVTDASETQHFEVTGAECGVSDHSATSPVISCLDYGVIRNALEAIIPGAGAPLCSGDW